MTSKSIVSQVLIFVFYIFLQIFFVRQLVLFDYAFCFVYVASIILLPFEINKITLIFLSFVAGITVDIFYNTVGANAAAMTLIAFLRPTVIGVLAPRRGYDERQTLTLNSMGLTWFIAYATSLIFVHHLVLFLLEASDWGLFLPVMVKVICSTIFTTIIVVIIQFFRRD
jgi:xanthosine utilization system XapX-like protein